TEGCIRNTVGSDRDMVPGIENCIGLITEEGGLTSHAAVVGLSLGIPVIVGVKEATTLIRHDQDVTMDAETGVIY
ncbi:PEP-utilizing enzyme, partial [Lysinibacillus fusiformis]|uniref:PEP-utilizing enzyme n=1 Tax=Lysinibacillus fusiformis TaxID=28031 RepID=UPI00201BE6C6